MVTDCQYIIPTVPKDGFIYVFHRRGREDYEFPNRTLLFTSDDFRSEAALETLGKYYAKSMIESLVGSGVLTLKHMSPVEISPRLFLHPTSLRFQRKDFSVFFNLKFSEYEKIFGFPLNSLPYLLEVFPTIFRPATKTLIQGWYDKVPQAFSGQKLIDIQRNMLNTSAVIIDEEGTPVSLTTYLNEEV